MCFEWYWLCADDHLSGGPKMLQQASRGRGSLQTADLLPVPNACHVNCRANRFDSIGGQGLGVHPAMPDPVVKGGEVTAREIKVEEDQVAVRFQN
jgi:hypothetical protein